MLERDLQRKCVKYARDKGFWASKFVAMGRRSAPDYIFARDGNIVFVEFKRAGEKPTKLQEAEHDIMRSFGVHVVVCDNFDSFKRVIIQATERH